MASIGRRTGTEEFRNWHFEEGPDVIQVRFLTKAFKMVIMGYFKVEHILKGSLDLILSPSVKIQIMGGKGVKAKHCWMFSTNF